MTRLGSFADSPDHSTRVIPGAEKTRSGVDFDGVMVDGRPAEAALGESARQGTAADPQRLIRVAGYSGGSVVRGRW